MQQFGNMILILCMTCAFAGMIRCLTSGPMTPVIKIVLTMYILLSVFSCVPHGRNDFKVPEYEYEQQTAPDTGRIILQAAAESLEKELTERYRAEGIDASPNVLRLIPDTETKRLFVCVNLNVCKENAGRAREIAEQMLGKDAEITIGTGAEHNLESYMADDCEHYKESG